MRERERETPESTGRRKSTKVLISISKWPNRNREERDGMRCTRETQRRSFDLKLFGSSWERKHGDVGDECDVDGSW